MHAPSYPTLDTDTDTHKTLFKIKKKKPACSGSAAFSPSTWAAESDGSASEADLVHRGSPRTARAAQEDLEGCTGKPCLKKEKITKCEPGSAHLQHLHPGG